MKSNQKLILGLSKCQTFSLIKGRKKCPGGTECLFVTDPEKYWRHPMAKAILFYGTDFDPHQDLPLPRHSGNHNIARVDTISDYFCNRSVFGTRN